MNWLAPPAEPPGLNPPLDPSSPSESNLNYWAARLSPLHDPAPGYTSLSPVERADPGSGKEVVFVACNRVGEEEGTPCHTSYVYLCLGVLMLPRANVCGNKLRHDHLVASE